MRFPPQALPYAPATFQDRGVAVPFTTPVLGGTRVRAAARARIELIARNPADGRGVYVTPWTDGATLWRPTLHDRVLIKRISGLDRITPASIREAARATAMEGLAGDAAAQAAHAATEAEQTLRGLISHRLLVNFIRQVGSGPDAAGLEPGTQDLGALAHFTNDWVVANLHRPRNWAAATFEAIAAVMADVSEAGRVPRWIARLRQTREEIAEWSRTQLRNDRMSRAYMVYTAAELTLTMTEMAVAEARLRTSDMLGLLRDWAYDPAPVIRSATRAEWLLDGWDLICLIWSHAADDAARCAALIEVVDYVPVLPREANDWSGNTDDLVVRRPGILDADWRNGASVVELIARNEAFRALAL